MKVRDVLNEVKWRLGRLEDVEITYRHRGAPNDERTVSGSEVRDVGRSFLRLDEASIPHHRVLRIELDGRAIWER